MRNLHYILLLLSLKIFSQDFEGKVEYKFYYFPSGNNAIDTLELKKTFGSTSTFITKKGKYKQITDSDMLTYQLYIPEENRLYFQDRISPDQLFYLRGEKSDNTPFEYEIVENADTILGYSCNKLTYQSGGLKLIYYYAPKLKINPKYYKDFSYLNRNKVLELIRSVFLRQDIEMPDFIGRIEAYRINPTKISDSEFIKPEAKIVREQ